MNGVAGTSSSGTAAASGAILQAAAGMYEQLKGEWNRKSPNLSKCGEELGRLKVRIGRGCFEGSRPNRVSRSGGNRARTGLRRTGLSNRVKDSEEPRCGLEARRCERDLERTKCGPTVGGDGEGVSGTPSERLKFWCLEA